MPSQSSRLALSVSDGPALYTALRCSFWTDRCRTLCVQCRFSDCIRVSTRGLGKGVSLVGAGVFPFRHCCVCRLLLTKYPTMDSAWSVLCKGMLSESTKRKQRPPGDRSDQVIIFEITANAADQQRRVNILSKSVSRGVRSDRNRSTTEKSPNQK